jgi:hypothetical protein
MSARGTASIASSVENPTSTEFGNALAPLAKLLRRPSLCVIPSEEDVQYTFLDHQEGCRRLLQSGESMRCGIIGQLVVG